MTIQFQYKYKLSGSFLKKEAVALFLPEKATVQQIKRACGKESKEYIDAITKAFKEKKFHGKSGEIWHFSIYQSSRYHHVILAGLGKSNSITSERLRRIAGKIIQTAHTLKLKSLALIVQFGTLKIPVQSSFALVQGAILANYRFEKFQTTSKEKDDDQELEVEFYDMQAFSSDMEIAHAVNLTKGSLLARDLGNTPANHLRPADFADVAQNVANESNGLLSLKVLEEAEMKELGMDLFLSVSQGSEAPAKLIILEYNPENAQKTVAFVGKGVTFDSGGLSLKPSKGMEEMKFDMCGAAAVMGAMQNIIELKPAVRVIGAIAATENLPSGTAQCPGDIWKTYSGKTVEVLNTDAEGRLILADTLSYIEDQYQPDFMIDLATLTGACIVALGHYASGMISNSNSLANQITNAAEETGELVWRLPDYEEYEDTFKSDYADIKNIGDGSAGTITAGLFLKQFVSKTNWAHLDIAGTAWGVKGISYLPKGATGVGVRLLTELLKQWSK